MGKHVKTIRVPGSIWYVGGSKTKVRYIRNCGRTALVEILGVGRHSKFTIGKEAEINQNLLYPEQRR